MYKWIKPRNKNWVYSDKEVTAKKRPGITINYFPTLEDKHFPINYRRMPNNIYWHWSLKTNVPEVGGHYGVAETLIDARLVALRVLSDAGSGPASMALIAMEDRYGARKDV